MFGQLLLLCFACLVAHGYSAGFRKHDNDAQLTISRVKRQYNYNPYYWGYWLGSQFRPPNYYYYRTTRRPYYYRPTTQRPRPPPAEGSDMKPPLLDENSVCACTRRFKREVDHNLTDSFRIVGGEPTRPHAYPQIVLIIYNSRQMCGGTILNSQYILTAAHCVEGNTDASKYRVTVGAYDLKDQEANRKTVTVKKAIPNTRFNTRTFANDLALLELNEPLEFNSDVKPTCLALGDNDYAGDDGIAVGWGRTTETGESSDVLREVTIPILPNRECQSSYSGLYTIYNTMICAGEKNGGKDSCAGDSGGPLFAGNSVQVGITSFGLGCARREKPGVYTRITAYTNWIMKNVNLDSCKIYSDDM